MKQRRKEKKPKIEIRKQAQAKTEEDTVAGLKAGHYISYSERMARICLP
jgi:hypothetical protein